MQCPDQKGIIARVSGLVVALDGNILSADQHATSAEGGQFFLRLEFRFDPAAQPPAAIEAAFAALARDLKAEWRLRYASQKPRCAVLVSARTHCLSDLLYRHASGELDMDIQAIIGNHLDGRRWAEMYGIPFHHIPSRPGDGPAAEAAILEQVRGRTDFLVLARYMRVLSPEFLAAYGRDIINIHHSFLPSFKGAGPYQQAYDRGVKIIGATAHFVTGALDEGPIIEQMVQRVSHRDDVEALRRKGADLERMALANALQAYTRDRVIRHRNKTVVFD